jgi:hypothetical protein
MGRKFYREVAKYAKEVLISWFKKPERIFSFPSRPWRLEWPLLILGYGGSKVLVPACPDVMATVGACPGQV